MADDVHEILRKVSEDLGQIKGLLVGLNGGGLTASVERLRHDFDNRFAVPMKCEGLTDIKKTLERTELKPRERLRTAGVYVAIAVNIMLTVYAILEKTKVHP